MKTLLSIIFLVAISIGIHAEGNNCETALVAVVGTNHIPTTDYDSYYYTFTMPSYGKLIVSTTGNELVFVDAGDCSGQNLLNIGVGGTTVTTLIEGETVLIEWKTRSGGNYDWELSVEPLGPGDTCATAQVATEGTNTLPISSNDYLWYKYTMPSDSKIEINPSTSLKYHMYTNTCDNLRFIETGSENSTLTDLQKGDELFIQWYTMMANDFNWDLTISPIEPGDNCKNAIAATEGINTIPATSDGPYWFTFTMPSSGKLQIESSSEETLQVYKGTCDVLKNAYYCPTMTSFVPGDIIFIRWDITEGGDFDWSLKVMPFEPGDLCSTPVPAVYGNNSCPETSNSQYWYSYTMPTTGRLIITSLTDKKLLVTPDCSSAGYSFDGNGSIQSLLAGEQVLIAWNTRDGGNFDWQLNIEEAVEGDACMIAATAELGTNHLPATDYDFYIYTYIMSNNGKLRFTSSTDQIVSVFTGSCGNGVWKAGGYGNANISGLCAGDTVMIIWLPDNGGNFDWTLSYEAQEPGDHCNSSIPSSIGNNLIPSTSYPEIWYSHVMSTEGRIVVTSASSMDVIVYTGSCEDLDYYPSGTNSVIANDISIGDTVYFKWNTTNGGNFEWNLNIETPEPGDNCSHAIDAINGTNNLPATINPYYWYSFVMPSDDKKVIITSSSSEYVSLYTGTCDNVTQQHRKYENIVEPNLSGGDEVLIRWETDGGGDFNWDLNVVPLENGDNCSFADTAYSGTNYVKESIIKQYWYKYTVPRNGDLIITSLTYDDVYIYTGTCENKVLLKEDYHEIAVNNLLAGEHLFIVWSTIQGGDFYWNLSLKQEQFIAFNPITSQNNFPDSLELDATASSSLPVSYRVISGSAILDSNIVYFTDRGTFTIQAMQGGNNNYYYAEPVQQTFSSYNVIHQVKEINKDLIIYPNPVSNQLSIECGNLQIEQIQLYSVDGRLITNFNPNSKILEMGKLNNGIYILKLSTADKVYSHRILKK